MPPQTKPKPVEEKPKTKYTAAQVLLGEAVGEGHEGMAMVRDIIANRARAKKKTLNDVVAEPYQFSAYTRTNPDLGTFVLRQPIAYQNLANELIEEASRPDYKPKYENATHFENIENWKRAKNDPKAPLWLKTYVPVAYVGNHVILAPPDKQPKKAKN